MKTLTVERVKRIIEKQFTSETTTKWYDEYSET